MRVSQAGGLDGRSSAHLPPQSSQPLLLGVRVNVGADHECHDVEERYPSLLGKELLGKRQRDWRSDPADLHDWHEAGPDGGTDLVEGPSSGDDGHGSQIDGVLDGCNL